MRDDYAPARDARRDLRQAAGDELVGQAVEAVAAHAFRMQAFGNRVVVRECAVAAMECGVEAGDLRQVGKARPDRSDRCEIVGLVQRRQGNVALQPGEHRVIDHHGPVVVRAAVHHAMSDRDRIDVLRDAQPRAGLLHRGGEGGGILHRICVIDHRPSVPDAVHLALDQAVEVAGAVGPEQLELDARRSRIGDEDRIHGGSRC